MELLTRLEKSGFRGLTLSLKIKYSDFTNITRSITSDRVLTKKQDILPLAKELLRQVDTTTKPIRLIGLSMSNPCDDKKRPQWVEQELHFKEWD